MDSLNKSKLKSPIVLIDPTFKDRNATGALSHETFEKFQSAAKKFLKDPDGKFFQYKRVDLPYLKSTAQDLKAVFAVFELKTKKQEGDVAASKMLKFAKVLSRELGNHFDVIETEFDYWGEKTSNMYYVLKRKSEIIHTGPSVHDKKAAISFKKKHRIWYEEDGRVKSAKPTDLTIKEFMKYFKSKYKKTMKEMKISKINVV